MAIDDKNNPFRSITQPLVGMQQSRDRNKKGTGFTNIGKILNAASGSNRLGGAVSSGIQQAGQNVAGEIEQAGSVFKTQAQKEAEKFNEQAAKERQGLIQQVASGSAGMGSDDLFQKFSDYRTSEYKGPKTIENYDALTGKAAEAEQLGRLGTTSGGREELLKRFVGGKDYSAGERNLDATILGLTGQQALTQAQRATRGLTGELAETASSSSGLAKQLQEQAKKFGQETIGQLEGIRNPVLQGVSLRTQQALNEEQKRSDAYKRITELLQNPTMTKTVMSTGPESGETRTLSNVDQAVSELLNSQYLTPQQADDLLRYANVAKTYGLKDIDKLIYSGLTESQAKNIQNSSLISQQESERLNLIDRLMGKTGTDVGLPATSPYERGQINLNLQALKSAVEAESQRRRDDLTQSLKNSLTLDPTSIMLGAAGQLVSQPGKIIEGGVNAIGDGITNVSREASRAVSNVGDEFRRITRKLPRFKL